MTYRNSYKEGLKAAIAELKRQRVRLEKLKKAADPIYWAAADVELWLAIQNLEQLDHAA